MSAQGEHILKMIYYILPNTISIQKSQDIWPLVEHIFYGKKIHQKNILESNIQILTTTISIHMLYEPHGIWLPRKTYMYTKRIKEKHSKMKVLDIYNHY